MPLLCRRFAVQYNLPILINTTFILSSQTVPSRHRGLAFRDTHGQSINSVQNTFPISRSGIPTELMSYVSPRLVRRVDERCQTNIGKETRAPHILSQICKDRLLVVDSTNTSVVAIVSILGLTSDIIQIWGDGNRGVGSRTCQQFCHG